MEGIAVSAVQFCMDHVGKDFKLYYKTCGELVCCECALKGGTHQSHDVDLGGSDYAITGQLKKQVTTIKKA